MDHCLNITWRRIAMFLLCFPLAWVQAQSAFFTDDRLPHDFIERMEIKSGKNAYGIHTSLKPFERKAVINFLLESQHLSMSRADRAIVEQFMQDNPEWSSVKADSSKRALLRKLYVYPNDMYRYQSHDFSLSVNPVMHLQLGEERDRDSRLFQNTRGVEVRGLINQKLAFYTYMADNQGRYPLYVNQKSLSQEDALPGEGWNQRFAGDGYDYFTARGYVAFQPIPAIGVQFGQDRNFLGHGTRSLLLSDYANNYLFLKLNTRIGPFHYQNIFAELIDYPLRSFGGRMFDKKYMVNHLLSVNLGQKWQLGFFENVIFGRTDTLNRRGFEMHYLNPLIFYRAVEHHIGDPDKVALGMQWRYLAARRFSFYGQVYIDDFHIGDLRNDIDSLLVRAGLRKERKYTEYASFHNKFALQLGMKWIDFLGLDNLDVQLEANWVRPFVYTHYDTDASGIRPAASHSHYSQALAHPLGANFREWIVAVNYRPHARWLIQSRLFDARQGMDQQGVNKGSNILADYSKREGDFNHFFLQGDLRKTLMADTRISWQWKPGLWLDVQYLLRDEKMVNQAGQRAHVLQAGIRLNAAPRNFWF